MKNYAIILCTALLTSACTNQPDYDATGIFEATTVTVSAETTGKVIAADFAEGDIVKGGSILAQIDTAMLALQRAQLNSQQKSAMSTSPDIAAQAAALRSQIAHQESEVARQKRLLADGATTQKMADDAEAALRTLRAQLEGLLSSLGKTQNVSSDNALAIEYQKAQIEENIAKSTVCSPIDATVLEKYIEAGEFAVPGKPLAKLADLNKIYLRSYFTAEQLAQLQLGQNVTVIADFGGDEQYEYPGTITWIAEESEFTPKSIQTRDTRANLVYAVKIAVKNDGRLKLGQYGEVRL